ncbi:DUF898 family protein [Rhodobacteraceae bacterium NNCM2]|nr:DUF898 family protein [Coraliihabitans acroporae]
MSDETWNGGEPAGRPRWDLERYRVQRDDGEGEGEGFIPPPKVRPENAEYTADGWVLFWMALKTAFLSIVTLGIYRFWMITKLRRHYWSGIQIHGDPLEYTGRGIEKLLGFLLALVFLAVYLGLINLGLTFLGFTYAGSDPVQAQLIINLSIFATVPLIFFAQYRAMRYMLSRTRWRGIRFGMGPGSFGYMIRAILLSLLTGITLGLAYPYQHFKLAQYMTNRSWFGSMKFEQRGTWVDMFACWIWIYIMLAFMAVSIYTIQTATDDTDTMSYLIAGVLYVVAIIVFYLTIVRYRFNAFKVLWSGRRLGPVEFESGMNISEAVKVYLTGSIVTGAASTLIFMLATGAMAAIFVTSGDFGDLSDIDFENEESMGQIIGLFFSQWPVLVGFLVTYLLVIAVVFALTQVFFTHRLLLRQVSTLTISSVRALAESQQREQDSATEAGGFADALGVDVGAGF